ncbi:TIGR02281 family clan AA aspartic protease [Sphingomonas koreensis]|nr:TIGR02281 family clan AA aspartic protease [Sphingomonas koreensis]
MPIGQAAKMALAWVAIFAVAMLIVSARHRVAAGWARVTDAIGGGDQSVVGGNVRINKADDGHFWADASINGVKRRMLIDSGATTTAISADTAQAAQLDLSESPFATILSTANGSVAAQRSSIASLEIGSIDASDLPVVVSASFGDTDVLGMNFLSRLKGWRVEGDTLILEPRTNNASLT